MVAAYPEEQARRVRRDLDFLKQYNPWGQSEPATPAAQPQATQAPTAPAVSSVVDKGIPYKPTLSPEAQAYNQRLAAKAAQDQVATKYGTTVPAGGIAQNPAVQQPAEEREPIMTAEQNMERYRKMMGESEYAKAAEKRYADRQAELAKEKDNAVPLGMLDFFGKLAAGEGWGKAIQGGVGVATQQFKDIRAAQDKMEDAKVDLAKAQEEQKRAEVTYGLGSERADKAAAKVEKHQDKVLAQALDIAKMQNETTRAGQANQLSIAQKQIEALAPVRQSQMDYRERVAANNEIKSKIAALTLQYNNPTLSKSQRAALDGQINNLMRQLNMGGYNTSALAGTSYGVDMAPIASFDY